MMRCALCLQESELIRSHIIPEFLYDALYDEKHRFHVLSVIPDKKSWLEQKGFREKLLCNECEQRFSVWERYASLVLKGGVTLNHHREGNLILVSGLDYSQFKLFQLSILWRAGVSRLPFFRNVQLGEHAEKIRQYLIVENPGPQDRYGCLMFGLKHGDQTLADIIVPPVRIRIHNHVAYRFVFGGFMWAILVSNHSPTTQFNHCALSIEGSMAILVREASEMADVNSFFRELQTMGRIS